MSDWKYRGLCLCTEKSEDVLGRVELEDYCCFREGLADWVLDLGKEPKRGEGYSFVTAKQRMYRLDRFYRWLWSENGGYTLDVSDVDADGFMREMAVKDCSSSYKASMQKSLKMLFSYLEWEEDREVCWEPEFSFDSTGSSANPKDFLTKDERRSLRQAALSYGSIPGYSSVSPGERGRWKSYLAQRFEKPKSEVSKADWRRANGFKEASIIWTSLDAGLRNVEVKRARTDWVDTENGVLRIPEEDSSKNRDNWIVGLQDRTVNILENWLEERRNYEKYNDSDRIWLTQYGNPYSSKGLNRLLDRILEQTGIERIDEITWYSIRRSTATYIANQHGLSAAQRQLRHKSPKTTMRYHQVPIEEIKDTLQNIE